MRQILFRGKRTDSGEWVEGCYIFDWKFGGEYDPHAYIVNHDHPSGCFGADIYVEVDPSTLGQYTGQNDKHGNRIFEDDVVKFGNGWFIVMYIEHCIGFCFAGLKGHNIINGFTMPHWEHLEVIGNIHDNPELLNSQK